MRWTHVLFPSAFSLLLSLPLPGQEVVSAYAGAIHFLEGSVFLDDQPLEHRPAVFPSMKINSTLRTTEGRAEVLLTSGVVLRIDENSAIRMISNRLTDTRVEFLKGAAILDTVAVTSQPPLVLIYQRCEIRFPKPGIYRLDDDTGVLQAYMGEAKVLAPEGKTSLVDSSKLFFFDLGTLTNKFGEPNEDEFYDWARGRADAISAENQLAAQSQADAADPDSTPYLWTAPVPYSGNFPVYSTLDPTYLPGSMFNPYFAFGAQPFVPFGVWPVVVLDRRGLGQHQHWPHRPVPTAASSLHMGVSSSPLRAPVFQPRPLPSVSIRAPRSPVYAAPHPVAPSGVRPIVHR